MGCEHSTWLGTWKYISHNSYCMSRMVWVTWVFLTVSYCLYRTNRIRLCISSFFWKLGIYIFISPFFSINLLSFLFEQTFDAHDDKSVENVLPSAFRACDVPPRCLQSCDCYVDAIYFTIGTTFLSFLLSLWAGYRDSWKAANRGDISEGTYVGVSSK